MRRCFSAVFCCIVLALNAQSTAADHVKIISEHFEMPQLNTTRRIWIYLPPDYQNPHKHFPVIYLHDGQNLFDAKTSYAGEWEADEALNRLSQATGKGIIAVGIDNGGDRRIAELSPFKNEKYGGGEGEKYVRFITETLKPYIDRHYRTKSNKKNTMIGGSSLGALISVYAAVAHPSTFGKVLAFSPAFWFNSKDLSPWILSSNSRLKGQKYYLIQGAHEDEGMEAESKKVIRALQQRGAKSSAIYFRTDEDGKHNEAYWRREFAPAVQWLMK